MTPRSIRRAQERKARKEMLRKAKNATPQAQRHLNPEPSIEAPSFERDYLDEDLSPAPAETPEPTLFASSSLSVAQLAANRANAQLSTGPTSGVGKKNSSLNAVKTGLTGRTVLLPTEEVAGYERHVRSWQDDLQPQGARECDLVQSIADTSWRLQRIPGLESAIFAQGHMEFAEAFNQHDPALRSSMIEVQTFMKYEKQLRNLQLQESRLVRRREKELAELRQLQQARKEGEREALAAAARLYSEAEENDRPAELTVNGFVFSSVQIEQYLTLIRRQIEPRSAAAARRAA